MAGYETLGDIVSEAELVNPRPWWPIGKRFYVLWGVIAVLAFYIQGALALTIVLVLAFLLYLLIFVLGLVLTTLDITAGSIEELKWDLALLQREKAAPENTKDDE